MIGEKDKRWMDLARRVLKQSLHPKYRFSSILVRSGRVINIGINSSGGPAPFYKNSNNRGRHAECRCLYGLSKKATKGCTLYCCGETIIGNLACSRPCSMCWIEIERMSIKRIVHYSIKGELVEIKI